MSERALLRVNLRAGYRKKPVLTDIQFELQRGEVLGVVGSSGAGKSTLVLSLLGLLPWKGGVAEGEVLLGDENLLALREGALRKIRGRRLALIPQSPMSALNGAVSLQTHFDEAWKAHSHAGRGALQDRLALLLAEVQLPGDAEFLRRRPGQISVGQAQRVLIAMALLHQPELIIADEPTSALDPVTQIQIIHLLKQMNRVHGTTLLYISHDLVSVLRLCDRVAAIDQGALVETLPVDALDRATHPALLRLLESLPVPVEVLLRYRDEAAMSKLAVGSR